MQGISKKVFKYDLIKKINELKQIYSDALDEQAMQWQESAENEYCEFHEVSKKEYDQLIKDNYESQKFAEELLNYIENN